VRPAHAGRRPIPTGFNLSLPGVMVMYLMMNLLIFGGVTMAWERRSGVLRRIAVHPVTQGEILTGKLYGLTFVYTGYPMVREAREIVARGDLGAVRKVIVEYSQGWLSRPIERDGDKQAGWRADPAQAGVGGAIGDIGVHAFNIAEFVSGARVERLCADLAAVVPGRTLDDDCNVLLRFAGGARGVLIASQINARAYYGASTKR